jgi:hypothetical protein
MSALKDTFKKYPNPIFIETGCYHGDGIQMALDAGFKMNYSIELDPINFAICQERFKDNPHVKLIFGDSCEMLEELIKTIKKPITFWLDAHSDKHLKNWIGKYKSPLIQELDAIKRHYTKGDKILIDDLRAWDMKYYSFTPKILKEKILEIDKDYKILFENGTILNDILVAI